MIVNEANISVYDIRLSHTLTQARRREHAHPNINVNMLRKSSACFPRRRMRGRWAAGGRSGL